MILSKPATLSDIVHFGLVTILAVTFSCSPDRTKELVLETDAGEIVVKIYPDKAPLTASNFLNLVEQGIYTGACFYRVVRLDNQPDNQVKIEVIQGGLLEDSLLNRFRPIAHEPTSITGIRHTDGAVSMARNQPGTASTEFFICIGDQPSLDFGGNRNPDGQGFAAFGKVISGMDVVRTIQKMQDSAQYLVEPVLIRKIKILR